jgi:flagellar hook-length control protein FliK
LHTPDLLHAVLRVSAHVAYPRISPLNAISALAPEPQPARLANAASVDEPRVADADASRASGEARPRDDDKFASLLDAETDKVDDPATRPGPRSSDEDGEQGRTKASGKPAKPSKGAAAQRSKSPASADPTPVTEAAAPKSAAGPTNLTLALSAGVSTPDATGGTEGAAAVATTPATGAATGAAAIAATALAGVPTALAGVPTAKPGETASATPTTPLAAAGVAATPTTGPATQATPAAATLAAGTPADPAAATPQGATPPHAQGATHAALASALASAGADPTPAAIDPGITPTPPPTAPQTTTTTPIAAAATNSTPAALHAAPDAAVQVYHRIIERNDGRSQRFEMRLDPVELGRVDIRIEVNADQKVHAVLAAHDSAALSDLVKGQKGLEQALKDSGLDLADGGLKFELSADTGRGFAGSENRSQTHYEPGFFGGERANLIAMPATPEVAAAAQPSWRPQRLNLVA